MSQNKNNYANFVRRHERWLLLVSIWTYFNLDLFPFRTAMISKEESIPVGCVPPTCWPYPVVSWWGCLPGGDVCLWFQERCLPKGVFAQGVSAKGWGLPRVCVYPSMQWRRHSLWTEWLILNPSAPLPHPPPEEPWDQIHLPTEGDLGPEIPTEPPSHGQNDRQTPVKTLSYPQLLLRAVIM